jgi:hypothetical protein
MQRIIVPAVLLASAACQPALAQSSAGSAFNPAISLTLMGQYAAYSGTDELELPGFQLGGEAGLPGQGLGLDHSEITLSANIDPYFFGQMTAALASHGGETALDLEEAFVETSLLPAGFGLTFGRFLSGVGYLNSHHRHSWDFVDAPLPMQAFLGGNFYDDGLRLTWLAPTALFLELGAEAFRGSRFPGAGEHGNDAGMHTLFAHLGGDIGLSHSWQIGLSRLWADPVGRVGGHDHDHDHGDDHSVAFSGKSNLSIVDAIWKWAPSGNPQAQHLTLQTEYFQRNENGSLEEEPDTALYRGKQRGLYTQAVYQFMPRWRTGLRYDRLWSNNRSDDATLLDEAGLAGGDTAQRYSAMLDFSPSEFSRLRLQYTRSDIAGETDHAVFLQYIVSLGAHGAHRF